MEHMQVLEEKINSLIALTKTLQSDNELIKMENDDLKTENAKLAEETDQLKAQLEAAEKNDTNELEKTKLMVDDLISNIDSLVKNEQAQ